MGNLVVDLGYQLNQGKAVNDTLVTFRNVRYAAAPIEGLRFSAPIDPPTDRANIQDHPDVIPPQAYPHWLIANNTDPVTPDDLPPADPRTSEDCLFLDVLLPESIWKQKETAKAPVLVWIPGGGFDLGWKDASGCGEGLVLRSQEDGAEGLILVSINYRVGLFGWMHGQGVQANAGLLDQRFALEWVQKYVHLFGGDKDRVTILGESAGGGSVAAHVTAYGGTRPSPFSSAIAQSPYLPPIDRTEESSLRYILEYGNIDSLETLRQQSTEKLQELNALIIANAKPFGNFVFGLVVDGDYVPDLVGRLISDGQFDDSLTIMTGYCFDEGSRFVSSALVTNEQQYEDFLKETFPTLGSSPQDLRIITQQLYPPIFDGSQPYTDQNGRNSLTIAEAKFVCNARCLNNARSKQARFAYEFTAPTGLHGADLPYTFFETKSTDGVNPTVAVSLQRYITNFAQKADPNGPRLTRFPSAKPNNTIFEIGIEGLKPLPDQQAINARDARCAFWQQAPYLGRMRHD